MQATSRALDHFLRAVGDPVADLRSIGPGHAEFEWAQNIHAATGVLAKVPDAFPAIARAIRTDTAISAHTRAHFDAAQAWLSADPALAADRYTSILRRWPYDLLALRLVQSCYFFLGWHDRLCAIVDTAMQAWPRDRCGFDFVLAMAAFTHAENGDAAYAEALGRRALANDPACPFGVHAVTHALAESGRHRQGAQWMRDQHAHWSGESRMRTHNAWHLAMFDVEDGNVASALRILEEWLLPAWSGSPLDTCDAVALLWRLKTAGVGDGGRWSKVSEALAGTVTPGFWPYVDLHAALAHWAAGQQARVRQLEHAIEVCAQGNDYAALRAGYITAPGLRASSRSSRTRKGARSTPRRGCARAVPESHIPATAR